MGDVRHCAWCGAKTKSECKAAAKCVLDNPSSGWGCLDHIHPNAEAGMNVAREALKPENQRIYPAGTTRDYESELAALREELAIVNREKNDVAYLANETAEKLNSMTISKATMRNQLKQKLAQTQQRLTAAEQRNAELEKDRDEWRTRATHRLGDCQGMMAALKEIERDTTDNDSRHLASGTVAEIIRRAKRDALKPTESGASE